MKRLVIVGAGGLGREVLTVVRDINEASPGTWDFIGFLAADGPDNETLRRINASYLGSDSDEVLLRSLAGTGFVAAVGSADARRSIHSRAARKGLTPVTLVHPTAIVGEDVEIGEGSIICAGSNLTTNIRVGVGAVIDRSVNLGHDCSLGDFVTLAPGATISGNVTVGDEAYMGTNSCTIQGVSIGAGTTVGAGAVVTRDVGDSLTVVGVPARPINR